MKTSSDGSKWWNLKKKDKMYYISVMDPKKYFELRNGFSGIKK